MKTKYIIIIALSIIVIIGGICLVRKLSKETIKEEDLDISEIKSFYITYSNGYAMNYYTRYELDYKDGVYIAKIKPHGIREEDLLEIEVEKEVMERIAEILKKYQVNKWDGFDKTDQGVLDGDSFSFSVSLEGNKTIHASGYMMWPENYSSVRAELDDLFMEIYNKEKGNIEDE